MQKKSCTPTFNGYNIPHMNETPKNKASKVDALVKAKKRGRPRGSTSFTRVKLSDLAKQVGSEATVVVSKRWLEDIGLTIDPTPTKTTEAIREVAEPEEKIQFSINTFD
mgnify:FL=1|tara:strand:- start:428 stop:754 length:327 start_codon:yes stop_codon:yes gene_type:complete